ncbi:MAG: L,D-transpeptidase [Anaerolineales bacterium]
MVLSRREFLKLSSLALAGLAARRFPMSLVGSASSLGRVSYDSVSVFASPKLNLEPIGFHFRDELLDIAYSLNPLTGPAYNPLWHKIAEGYVHAAFIQPVAEQLNDVLDSVPETGLLCRVTVPFSRPYNYTTQSGWQSVSLFLLYYESNHWVTAVVEGPDGEPWYQITESWEGIQYYAKAAHLQPIGEEDLMPISPEVPAGEKRIEISLATQTLTAYEGGQMVLRTPISSGVANSSGPGLPTETPIGSFNVFSKLPSKYMGDNRLTDTLGDRYLPGVPWTAFFAEGGYAIHGAYWHNNFGAPMSRGCVNVRPREAQWLYRWMAPVAAPGDWESRGQGTRVIVA